MLVGIEKTFSYPYCHIFTTFDNYYEMKWQEKLTVVCNIIIKNFESLLANNDWLQFGQIMGEIIWLDVLKMGTLRCPYNEDVLIIKTPRVFKL